MSGISKRWAYALFFLAIALVGLVIGLTGPAFWTDFLKGTY